MQDSFADMTSSSGVAPLQPKIDAGSDSGGSGNFYMGHPHGHHEEDKKNKKSKKPVKLTLSATAQKYLERLEAEQDENAQAQSSDTE